MTWIQIRVEISTPEIRISPTPMHSDSSLIGRFSPEKVLRLFRKLSPSRNPPGLSSAAAIRTTAQRPPLLKSPPPAKSEAIDGSVVHEEARPGFPGSILSRTT